MSVLEQHLGEPGYRWKVRIFRYSLRQICTITEQLSFHHDENQAMPTPYPVRFPRMDQGLNHHH
jgi:hypothetical protein